MLLDSKTVKAENGEPIEKHVLITRYDAQRAKRGEMLDIQDVLDILSTPFWGSSQKAKTYCAPQISGHPSRYAEQRALRRVPTLMLPTNSWVGSFR